MPGALAIERVVHSFGALGGTAARVGCRHDSNLRCAAARRDAVVAVRAALDYRAGTMSDDATAPVGWRLRVRAAWFSVALAILCVVAFVATLGSCVATSDAPGSVIVESFLGLSRCKSTLEGFGALSVARVWVDGEWWRVATTGLLHGGWLHLILNVWSLWSVGEWCERAWGAGRTAALFVLGSIAGALASMAWAEATMVVGASAGVLAIAGALLMGRMFGAPETQERLQPVSPFALIFTLVLMFAIGWVVPVIAQAGHVGGFAAGVGATWAAMQRGWMRLAVTVVLVLAFNELAQIAGRPEGRPRYHEFVAYRELDRGDTEAAVAALEVAMRRKPEDPESLNAIAYALALAGAHLDEADAMVAEALEAEPKNASYLDTQGWIACRRGDAVRGEELIREARGIAGSEVSWEIEAHLTTCATASVPRETSPEGIAPKG